MAGRRSYVMYEMFLEGAKPSLYEHGYRIIMFETNPRNGTPLYREKYQPDSLLSSEPDTLRLVAFLQQCKDCRVPVFNMVPKRRSSERRRLEEDHNFVARVCTAPGAWLEYLIPSSHILPFQARKEA
ncbi:hypothetical protein JW711_03020 [Candidatus Woesearchaeota archaeon]|nr:hypothetical protein [Candidatus Woesearchaeota archaeon]